MTPRALSTRRLLALCRKEAFQIVRDPSSILIAFVMPVILLFLYGFGISLDLDHVRVAVLRLDDGPAAVRFEQSLAGSPSFAVHAVRSREELLAELSRGEARGGVVIPSDFSAKVLSRRGGAIQVLTDGAEPNTASFVSSYAQGVFERWRGGAQGIEVRQRAWFNPSTLSRNFLVPGSIAVVMTIIGALLTSLVVAREWERGTMEALLATPVTRTELLLSKILPYYVLGLAAMALCTAVAVFLLGVPFHGSLLALFAVTTLFLGCALGFGLFLSTVLPTQFNAAQASLVAGFLPAMMLSGFVFEISSMPAPLRILTLAVPARYFTRCLSTLFQAGTLPEVLLPNALALAALTVFWLGLTARKTRRTLD